MRRDEPSFLRPGIVAGLGAAAGAWAGLHASGGGWAAGAALLVAAGLVLAPSPVGTRLPRRLALAALALAAGLLAGLDSPRPRPHPALDAAVASDEPVRLVGRLARPIQRRLAPPHWGSTEPQPRAALVVDVERVRLADGWHETPRVRVRLGTDDAGLTARVGDVVEGVARLRTPAAPANPGERDAREQLGREQIAYVGSLQRGALAVLVAGDGWPKRAERFRDRFGQFVRSRSDDPTRAALVTALAVGERGGIAPEVEADFNASGLAHVLSISGLHLAVAVLLLAWTLRRLFALSATLSAWMPPRQLAALVALPVTVLYVALVGAPPPAVRAGLGTGLALAAVALGRAPETWNTLGWSLAAIALIDPAALGDISTQLSFLGVAGLAYLTPRLRELVPLPRPDPTRTGWRAHLARLGENALLVALGSLAATLSTAPLTALYFERASTVAALANLVAWPASTLIVPNGALAAALFELSPTLATPLVALADLCAGGLVLAARVFGGWPLAALPVSPPSPAELAAYALLVVAAVNVRRAGRPARMGVVAAALLLAALQWPAGAPHPGRLEVTFLSVGQGDATVVRFPDGRTMVVDAGGSVSGLFDPGARLVVPFLRASQVRRIDWLVASHPHPDHIGGLAALLERYPVGEFWHNGDATEGGALAALIEQAERGGARPVDFRQGLPATCPGRAPLDRALPAVAALAVGDPRCAPPPPAIEVAGVRVEILHPLAGPDRASFPELGANDNSLVLRLVHGDVSVLLPGDIELEGEALLLARGAPLRADVLKAPHHGSRTSSTPAFLAQVRPAHVVFCVGERNQFGFPSPEVQARYRALGTREHRTDTDGAVTFVSDGRRLEWRHFRPGGTPASGVFP